MVFQLAPPHEQYDSGTISFPCMREYVRDALHFGSPWTAVFGQMTSSPAKIRELLLKSIDKDAKVVDTEGILKAISALEKMTITKEALEGTRLGKLVNNIRKAASDSKLKDRCKRLIQKWKSEFVVKQKAADSSNTTSIGQSKGKPPTVVSSPRVSPHLSKSGGTPVDETKSENRKRRKPDSPSTPPEDTRPSKKQSTSGASPRGKQDDKSSGRGSPRPKIAPGDPDSSLPKTRGPGRPRKSKSSKIPDGGKDSKSLHKQVLKSNATKIIEATSPSEQSPLGKSNRRSPRQERHKRNGSPSLLPSDGADIAGDAVDSPLPHDDTPGSPVDPAVNNVGKESSIFNTDDDHIEGGSDDLAMSSVPGSPVDSAGSHDSSFSSHSIRSDKLSEDPAEQDILIDHEDTLVITEPTEEHVRRLHEDHWELVNGNYCNNGSWSRWEECLVRDSGENHSLHILPYVVID